MQFISGKHVSRCVSLVADLGITNFLTEAYDWKTSGRASHTAGMT